MQKDDANSLAKHLIVLYFAPLQKTVRCHMVDEIRRFDNYGVPHARTLVFKHNLWLMCALPIKLPVSGEFKESIRSRIPLVKMLILVLSLLVLFNPTLLAQQEAKSKNVLVLASYKSTAPVGYLWDRGIRSVFEAKTSQRIETHVEYLDLNSFNDEHYIRILQDVLQHKYAKSTPDLIIPIYNRALGFVLEHGSEIFPEVPVVFAGVEQRKILYNL